MIVVEDLNKHFIRQGAQATADWRQVLRSLGLMKKQQELVKAVNGVSFRAEDGAITGLLGANGAGKITTLRMIAALLPSDSGNILVDGAAVTPGSYATQSQMGVLSDARGLYPRLTARENIRYYGRLHGLSAEQTEQRIEQLAQWLEMQPLLDRRPEGFSQGERMKTALARALVHDPKNIILDEQIGRAHI